MQLVNENSAVSLLTARRGDDGSTIAATTLKYRLDCQTTGTSLIPWTSVTPQDITSIVIPAASNAIQNTCNTFEDKVCTIMADEGLDSQETTEQAYRVRNLGGVS